MKIHNPWRAAAVLSLVSLASLPCLAARAGSEVGEQAMIQLSSDRNGDVDVLSALTDPNSVAKGLSVSVVSGGQVVKKDIFSIEQIASASGAVIATENGLAAVILQGQIDPASGGQARIRYLTNALSQTYAECKTAVRRSKDGHWNVINASTGQIVTHAHVKTWTLGISAIEGLCPGRLELTPAEQEAAIREWQLRHPMN